MKTFLLVLLIGMSPILAEESSRKAEGAVSLANAEAQRQFGVTPFTAGHGTWRQVDGRWQWNGLAGYGTGDLMARVSFSATGTADVAVTQAVLTAW